MAGLRLRHFILPLLCGFVLLPVLVVGCGSHLRTESAQQQAVETDVVPAATACPLTKEEVEAVTNTSLKDPISRDSKRPFGQQLYIFQGADGTEHFIQIAIVRSSSMSDAAKERGMTAPKLFYYTQQQLKAVEPVDGIGDEAYWGVPGLHILKGDMYVTIAVGDVSQPQNLTIAKQLAQLLLTKINE